MPAVACLDPHALACFQVGALRLRETTRFQRVCSTWAKPDRSNAGMAGLRIPPANVGNRCRRQQGSPEAKRGWPVDCARPAGSVRGTRWSLRGLLSLNRSNGGPRVQGSVEHAPILDDRPTRFAIDRERGCRRPVSHEHQAVDAPEIRHRGWVPRPGPSAASSSAHPKLAPWMSPLGPSRVGESALARGESYTGAQKRIRANFYQPT